MTPAQSLSIINATIYTALISQDSDNSFTPKVVKIVLAIIIPTFIAISTIYGITIWYRRRTLRTEEIELDVLIQEIENIARESWYPPHPLPPPPVYIPTIPLHHSHRSRGYPRCSPSISATTGHIIERKSEAE
jgi:hypothetical protein